MFYLTNLTDFWKYMQILNLMATTYFKQAKAGNNILGKLWNALETAVWNIPRVNSFIGNRR